MLSTELCLILNTEGQSCPVCFSISQKSTVKLCQLSGHMDTQRSATAHYLLLLCTPPFPLFHKFLIKNNPKRSALSNKIQQYLGYCLILFLPVFSFYIFQGCFFSKRETICFRCSKTAKNCLCQYSAGT